MRLYTESLGQGPDLVLLHGWGVHAGIFDELAAALAANYRVTLVDLPGHGRSPLPQAPYHLTTLVEAIAAATPAPAVWLGWSLGGMLSLAMAMSAPERVTRLILVAGSPQFYVSPDWPHAMKEQVLADFATSLEQDYQRTLERFLGLQVSGSTQARLTLQQLKEKIFRLPAPQPAALRGGLELLRHINLRPRLGDISQPSLLLYGDRDLLVPYGAGQYLASQLPAARLEIFKGAGHAPFISHPQDFLRAINDFLHHHG